MYNTTDNEFRINGRVRAYNDKGMAELGLSNIGDGTKFDLNAGRFISSKWLVRGGIFESELGLGVDYNLRGPVSLSAAVYDLNNRKYRIRSDIRLHKDTYGVIQMTQTVRFHEWRYLLWYQASILKTNTFTLDEYGGTYYE
ncbi:MAG: hypothetical protein ACLUPK_01410 [Veillonella sp.]